MWRSGPVKRVLKACPLTGTLIVIAQALVTGPALAQAPPPPEPFRVTVTVARQELNPSLWITK